MMNDYLEGKEIPVDKLKTVLRKAVIDNEIFPVFAGSALKQRCAISYWMLLLIIFHHRLIFHQ